MSCRLLDFKLSYIKREIQERMEREKNFVEKNSWGACSKTCKICGEFFICWNGRVSKDFCSEKCELDDLKNSKMLAWQKSLCRFEIKLFWKFYAKYFENYDEYCRNHKEKMEEWRKIRGVETK